MMNHRLKMKHLLLPLLAAISLPSAVNASEYKYSLVFEVQAKQFNVPMKSMEACEIALKKVLDMNNWQLSKPSWKPMGGKGICLENE